MQEQEEREFQQRLLALAGMGGAGAADAGAAGGEAGAEAGYASEDEVDPDDLSYEEVGAGGWRAGSDCRCCCAAAGLLDASAARPAPLPAGRPSLLHFADPPLAPAADGAGRGGGHGEPGAGAGRRRRPAGTAVLRGGRHHCGRGGAVPHLQVCAAAPAGGGLAGVGLWQCGAGRAEHLAAAGAASNPLGVSFSTTRNSVPHTRHSPAPPTHAGWSLSRRTRCGCCRCAATTTTPTAWASGSSATRRVLWGLLLGAVMGAVWAGGRAGRWWPLGSGHVHDRPLPAFTCGD